MGRVFTYTDFCCQAKREGWDSQEVEDYLHQHLGTKKFDNLPFSKYKKTYDAMRVKAKATDLTPSSDTGDRDA